MKRTTFLVFVSIIALTIGSIALFFPKVLLDSKGVISTAATMIWMRETGLLLFSMSILLFLIRNEEVSTALKAIFFSNILIQLGLLTIEVVGYFEGTITILSGILPNSILHITLTVLFLYYFINMARVSQSTD